MTFSFFLILNLKQGLMHPRLASNLVCSQKMTFNFWTTQLYPSYLSLQAGSTTPSSSSGGGAGLSACSANTSQPNTSPGLITRVFIPKALNTEKQIHFVENMANWHITLKIFMCSNLEIQIEKQQILDLRQTNIKSGPLVLAVFHLYE